MRRVLALAALAALVVGLSACTAASGGGTGYKMSNQAPSISASPTVAPPILLDDEDRPDPVPPPPLVIEPDADGTFTDSCDYLLGDFEDYSPTGYRFVADANLKNTGNIGTVVRVTATWFQAGGKSIVETKDVRVESGRSKRVGFTRLVGGDEIDLIQAFDFDEQCKVGAKIVDTFGEAI